MRPSARISYFLSICCLLGRFEVVARKNRRGDCRPGGFAPKGVADRSAMVQRSVSVVWVLSISGVMPTEGLKPLLWRADFSSVRCLTVCRMLVA